MGEKARERQRLREEGGKRKVKARNHLCLLAVCSIIRKLPSWFRAQQSPQPVEMSQSDGGYQLVAVK